MHPFKKGQHILFSGVTKGRRGPRVELTRKNVRPNHAGFLLQRHARVRRAATGTFFSSFNFVVFARLTTKCILYLLIPHTQKNFCQSECFFERVFRPLLVTQLFRKSEKEEKNFLPCVRAKSRDAFSYQNASEADLFNTLIYSLSELLRLYYRDEFDHR